MKTKEFKKGIRLGVSARFKTRIMDAATGQIVRERPWEKNLVFDQGLNAMAGQSVSGLSQGQFEQNFRQLQVGDGTDPVKIASGAITFTQSGTTLTASGGFFTANMAGGLFKWGTGSGGVENYIASYTDSTHVELTDSATVGVAEVGTVWQVQGTSLANALYSTSTYQTLAGDNSTIFDGTDTVTFQRTFIISAKGSTYNVNELGYSLNASLGANLAGRLVLSSTDVITPANFYVVVLQISVVISPAAPTAVADVGTNCDTTGNAMIEGADVGVSGEYGLFTAIQSTGAGYGTPVGLFDFNNSLSTAALIASYSQRSAPLNADLAVTQLRFTQNVWTKASGERGVMRKASSSSTTAAGQTWYGMAIVRGASPYEVVFDVKFTTPGTLPTGTFQPVTTWSCTFDRVLTN